MCVPVLLPPTCCHFPFLYVSAATFIETPLSSTNTRPPLQCACQCCCHSHDLFATQLLSCTLPLFLPLHWTLIFACVCSCVRVRVCVCVCVRVCVRACVLLLQPGCKQDPKMPVVTETYEELVFSEPRVEFYQRVSQHQPSE